MISQIQIMIYPSSTLHEDEATIQISTNLLKILNIPPTGLIEILAGSENVTALIQLNDALGESTIYLNQLGYLALKLPNIPIRLKAFYNNKNLVIGPIVAIMTEITDRNEGSPSFGSIHSFCEELHEYSQKHGGFYYVTSVSRLFQSGFYLLNGDWIEDRVPRPDVIYNRIHSRRLEASSQFKYLKEQWKKNNIIFFNDRFISKLEVHETLSKTGHFQSFIPETDLFHPNILQNWIYKFEDLYIKPETGSQGRRIIHLYKEDEKYHIEQTSFTNIMCYSFSTLHEVESLITQWIGDKKFLIQQAIPLIKLENKNIDFRFLCHKKTHTTWIVTSSVARMSGEGQFVSNLTQGGTIYRPLVILNSIFSKEKSLDTYKLMEELALEVAKVVSNDINGLIGELGIDIGVDITGKPWLIEVNLKPSKQKDSPTSFIRPSAKAICHLCFELWKERSQADDQNGNFDIESS